MSVYDSHITTTGWYSSVCSEQHLRHVHMWSPIMYGINAAKRLHTFISVINQLDAQNFCFTISLFHASTCFEHMCSSSGGQTCITQPLVSSHV